MQPGQKYIKLADPYCDIVNLAVQCTPPTPGKLRGVDFYNPSDLKLAMANSLEAFQGGNRFLPSILSPKTYNEKIFASKFLVPFPVPTLSDKLLINSISADLFGKQHVAEVIKVFDTPEEIEDSLTNLSDGIYFLKANHASGTNYRLNFNGADRASQIKDAKNKANEWLRYNFGYSWGEFLYATFPKKIFLERAFSATDASDYRFYCFNKKPRLIQVDQNSYTQVGHTRDYFDLDWKLLPIMQGFPMSVRTPPHPSDLDKMVQMAEVLSDRSEVSFVRVDFFWSPEFGVKVAEVTYMPTNGTRAFSPDYWNLKLGQWWDLSGLTNM